MGGKGAGSGMPHRGRGRDYGVYNVRAGRSWRVRAGEPFCRHGAGQCVQRRVFVELNRSPKARVGQYTSL